MHLIQVYIDTLIILASFSKGNILCDSCLLSLSKGENPFTLMHSEWPKLHRVLAILSAIGLRKEFALERANSFLK